MSYENLFGTIGTTGTTGTLANRKENYTREAAENFKGRIFVPDDLEVIEL